MRCKACCEEPYEPVVSGKEAIAENREAPETLLLRHVNQKRGDDEVHGLKVSGQQVLRLAKEAGSPTWQ